MSLLRTAKQRPKLLFALAALPTAIAIALIAFVMVGTLGGNTDSAQAQATGEHSTMQQRLNQLMNIMQEGPPEAVEQATHNAMEILYGGLRPLPSPQNEDTDGAHKAIGVAELQLAATLEQVALRQDLAGTGVGAHALDLKLFVEQMNEVAEAVGQVTRLCGEGMVIGDPAQASPCDDLAPLLDENNGQDLPAGQVVLPITLRPSYSVKLRSPLIPRNTTLAWEEDIINTDALGLDECSVVFKETRGLMLRLHFDRFIVVKDPWVTVLGFPRRTVIPIWSLEWVPSEYVKQFEICNNNGRVVTNVTQRVKQDTALNFFWRYYPANRGGKH